jgi:ABC-type phosphate transport system auxiliary subunit
VELTNEQVITEMATAIEVTQRLIETKKADAEIADLRRQAKDLEEERYNNELRMLKQRFKALRLQAKVRKLKFESVLDLPQEN